MRRFELMEGNSRKFWQIEVEGNTVTVHFGRIGTDGQHKTKSFEDKAAALAEEIRLIKEKTSKGYCETGGDEDPSRAAVPPNVESIPLEAARIPPTLPQPETQTVPEGEIEWPQSGFEWNDELLAQLPIIRGIRAEPCPVRCREMPPIPPECIQPDDLKFDWTTLVTTQRLENALEQEWHELFQQCTQLDNFCERYEYLPWALEKAIDLHGLPFATARLLECGGTDHIIVNGFENTPQEYCRRAIASSHPDVYDECVKSASAFADWNPYLLAYLFPDRTDWADACVRRLLNSSRYWGGEWRNEGWLEETAMSASLANDFFVARGENSEPQSYQGTALLQIRLYGATAMPLLATLLERAIRWKKVGKILPIVERLLVPELIPTLAPYLGNREVRDTLDQLAESYPAATLKTAIEVSKTSLLHRFWAVELAARFPRALNTALAALCSTDRDRFVNHFRRVNGQEEAPASELPELLRTPPWKVKPSFSKVVHSLEISPHECVGDMVWSREIVDAAEKRIHEARSSPLEYWMEERWIKNCPVEWLVEEGEKELRQSMPNASEMEIQARLDQLVPERRGSREEDWNAVKERCVLDELGISRVIQERLLVTGELNAEEFVPPSHYYYSPSVNLLMRLPATVAVAIWNCMPPRCWADWDLKQGIETLASFHGAAFLPGLLKFLSFNPELGLVATLHCRCGKLAPFAAHALKNTKKAAVPALEWLLEHPIAAIEALIPSALGDPGIVRDNAQFALRKLAHMGHDKALLEVAATYGPAAAQAIECMLNTDPTLVVPARMPKLPAFFVPSTLRRPLLKRGGALPLSAVEYLGNMLSISKLDDPYGGLAVVRDNCTPDSLAEFAWDVFEAWSLADYPSKESWAYWVLAWFGNDDTARRLTPKIRAWPGESANARAVTGLDILAAIGSDVALMHLNAIADKVKFRNLQERAREKIAAVAEARQLTSAELADRLAPDLGLDASGTLTLDFGPRRFFVAFDEELKPFVRDESGIRLKDLPKPLKSDDESLAPHAVERYKTLKKDAKAIASMQLARLEQAMCARRRWKAPEFRALFLEHPLVRHLARRLVWGVYRDGKLSESFRVAEDLSFANQRDEAWELPEDAEIGIVHQMELSVDAANDFGQMFADYEIMQPFRQLGRETFVLDEKEAETGTTTRFKDKIVATGSILGLVNRGWERGGVGDGGGVYEFVKDYPNRLEAVLSMHPGTVVGMHDINPRQTIPLVEFHVRNRQTSSASTAHSGLDPILVSEVLRDVELLAPDPQ